MRSKEKITAIILCGGSGTRAGLAYNKILHLVGKKTAVNHCIDAFIEVGVDNIVLVSSEIDFIKLEAIAKDYQSVRVVLGGETRVASVKAGLRAAEGCDIVCIHDGARPFLTPELIKRTIESAKKYGSGVPAVKLTDAIKQVENETITASVNREKLYKMQTPQSFKYSEILLAYQNASDTMQDCSEVFLSSNKKPKIVLGEAKNKKLTLPSDFNSLDVDLSTLKIGIGFDVHRLVENRKLILGGVTIPYHLGLLGHSDADVLTHAIMDALLSAANLPDIGVLFPDNDTSYKDISSISLLKTVKTKLDNLGAKIVNISAVVMAEKPKLASYILDIRKNLASALGLEIDRINVSATTTEGLGLIGENKGIASSCSVLL